METVTSILMLLAGTILVFGVPIGVSYLIYRYIEKRNFDKRLRLLALIPLLVLGYAVYQGIFHPNSLYEEHFREVTSFDFPENGEFVYTEKWTSGTYSRGYITLSLVKVDKGFYRNLPRQLEQKGLSEMQKEMNLNELLLRKIKTIKTENNLEVEKEYSLEKGDKIYYYVGFLSDEESLIVYAWHK